jgi:hypothetical protein
LRRENCQLAQYEAWFEDECNKLVVDPGLTIVGPITSALGNPDSPPWYSDLAIIYPGQMYIRVKERYRPLPKSAGGGGCLYAFSYHYGPCTDTRDHDGFPVFCDRFELRIDIDPRFKCHVHYQGEDHIPEARLPGLDFKKINPFQFIRAVEEHRRSSKPLHEILGFNVEPAI